MYDAINTFSTGIPYVYTRTIIKRSSDKRKKWIKPIYNSNQDSDSPQTHLIFLVY